MSIAASLYNLVPKPLVVEKADNRSGYEQELEAFVNQSYLRSGKRKKALPQ